MNDVLYIFFESLDNTQGSDTKKFDNSIYADILGADVGYALTTDGTSVQRYYHERHKKAKRTGPPTRLFDDEFWITDESLFTGDVVLRSGETVCVADYDTVLVSQVVFHTRYIGYLASEYPSLNVIAVQDESLWETMSLSARLQLHQMDSLSTVDGFVAVDAVYELWVKGHVDDVIYLPFPIPEDHYPDAATSGNREGLVALGVTPFNAHQSQFYSNIVVIRNLRKRGYDLDAEILGVKDWQRNTLEGFADRSWISLTDFKTDGYHEYLGRFDLAVNLTPRVSAGRSVADFAGMGVPCVGTKFNDLQGHCFPDLGVNPIDIDAATDLCERLLTDDAFYRETISKAQRAVRELQDHESIKTQLRAFIEDV